MDALFPLILLAFLGGPAYALELTEPDWRGLHKETLQVFSEQPDSHRPPLYRVCQPYAKDFQCYRIDLSKAEACHFEQAVLVCTSPTQSQTIKALNSVIKSDAE